MAEAILSPGVFQNETDQSFVSEGVLGAATAIVGPTAMGQPFIPTIVTSYTDYLAKFGSTFKSGSTYYEYFTSLAAKDFFANGGQSLLVTRIIESTASVSTYASASVAASGSNTAFVLETLAWGDQMNNASPAVSGALTSGSTYNVRWEITSVNTSSGQFTLAIRAGNDNTAQKSYLEIWNNLSLDPGQSNYISRIIGDLKPVFKVDSDGIPMVDFSGSYANKSRYVRVKSVNNIPDSLDNLGVFKSAQYSGNLPLIGSGSANGAFAGGVLATTATGLYNESITAANNQGFPSSSFITAFNLLSSKEDYRFNVIVAPGITLSNAAATALINMCENRGDTIAVIDTTLYGSTISAASTATSNQSSNYAATYYPWVQVFSEGLGKPLWVPPSTVVPGVYAFNDQVTAEWFAPAGLNRGGIPSVIRAERRLSQNDRDTLYENNINPLATFPGEGVVAFGQKTLQKKPSALDRVNVRRLMIALKNYIGDVAKGLVFEQNTNVTRNRFLSQVNPYLESVVQRQGLYAYKVVMDSTNNTNDVIDRNQLVGQIYIQPTRTAEFIILNFNLQPTGATFPA